MQLNPAILSDARILASYLIFFTNYFVFAWGKVSGIHQARGEIALACNISDLMMSGAAAPPYPATYLREDTRTIRCQP
jgi:hypothetical protein